jgi:isomerase DpgB
MGTIDHVFHRGAGAHDRRAGLRRHVFCVDPQADLAHLSADLGNVCDLIEDEVTPAAVVLRLDSEKAGVSWPWPSEIHQLSRWERALRRVERLEAVTIALAAGDCTGAALDLLLAVDYRIGTPDFCICPSRRENLVWPGMAMYRLVRQIGLPRSRRLLLSGAVLTAGDALAYGVIDQIAADGNETIRQVIAELGVPCGAELAIRRQLLLEADTTSFEDALGAHLAACDRELRRPGAASDREGAVDACHDEGS